MFVKKLSTAVRCFICVEMPICLVRTVNTTNRDNIFDLMTDLNNKILKVAVGFKKIDFDFYKKLIAAATVDATTTKPAQIKVVLKNETGTRKLKAMMARSLDSDKHLAANTKGVITFNLPKVDLKILRCQ